MGLMKAEINATLSDYDNGFSSFDRFNTCVRLQLTTLRRVNNLGLSANLNYSNDFDFLPSAAIVYKSEFTRFFVQLSAGYSQNEPSMHQLQLPFQRKSVYGSNSKEYSEIGNTELKKESQIVASLTIEPGTIDNHMTLSVTGGRIIDAIEWASQIQSGAVEVFHFSPVNDDITFATISARPNIRLGKFLQFTGGGAFHYYDYDSLGERPYQPEYSYFSGLELNYYWKNRLVHLFAYGELMYAGPYFGYENQALGRELVANAKLTLGLKNFRFYFIFQNTFDNDYQAREYMSIPGRFFYYGLTWDFFD
jgi:hypothetical protein